MYYNGLTIQSESYMYMYMYVPLRTLGTTLQIYDATTTIFNIENLKIKMFWSKSSKLLIQLNIVTNTCIFEVQLGGTCMHDKVL